MFFACDKMWMKHGFMSGFFFVICMDLGQLKLMKYCDTGSDKNNIKILLRDI